MQSPKSQVPSPKSIVIAMMMALSALLFAPGVLSAQEKSDGGLVENLEAMYQRAAEKAAPCVVAVKVTREKEDAPATTPAGSNPAATGAPVNVRPKNAPCSGTIIEPDGLILTSYFNVSGKVKEISVVLPEGGEKPAKLVGYHAGADLALLKIDAEGLPTLERSPLNQLKVCMPVVALGRGPDAKGLTLNPGIVSAPGRLAGRGVQVDTKMNFGNVGGPLVDVEGRLIGITCKVDVKTAAFFGQNSGVSFAITWNRVDELLPDLKKGQKKEGTGLPFLGIQYDADATVDDGVPLLEVIPGGSAETAGIQRGDVILEFDGKRTKTFDDLRVVINKKAVGDEVKVKLRRGEQEIELTLKLGERPGE